MKQTVAGLVALLLAPTALRAQAREGQVVDIMVVRTIGELMAQPAIALEHGEQVRVGLESRTPTHDLGLLVYALVHAGTHAQGDLGPLQVEIEPVDGRGRDKVKTSRGAVVRKGGSPLLYATSIILGNEGKFELTLRSPDGQAVARTMLTSGSVPGRAWYAFGFPRQAVEHDGDAASVSARLALSPSRPALPRLGSDPLHVRRDPVNGIAPAEPLPTWRRTPDPGLLLRAGPRSLELASQFPLDLSDPQGKLLFRLWVNQKPIQIDDRPRAVLEELKRGRSEDTTRLRIDLEWNAADLGAVSGDRIGVQLLYCPDGWRSARALDRGDTIEKRSESKASADALPRWPLLTNKAEFVAP